MYHSQSNNLVERQTFSIVNFIYRNEVVFTVNVDLSHSFSFLEVANVSFAPLWIRHWYSFQKYTQGSAPLREKIPVVDSEGGHSVLGQQLKVMIIL